MLGGGRAEAVYAVTIAPTSYGSRPSYGYNHYNNNSAGNLAPNSWVPEEAEILQIIAGVGGNTPDGTLTSIFLIRFNKDIRSSVYQITVTCLENGYSADLLPIGDHDQFQVTMRPSEQIPLITYFSENVGNTVHLKIEITGDYTWDD